MDYSLTLKKNEVINFVGKWMNLEKILLNEVSQIQKDKCFMFSFIYCLWWL